MAGVAFLLVKDNKVLMEKRSDGGHPFPGTWRVPGGKLNRATEPWTECLKREIREELGVRLISYQGLAGTFYWKEIRYGHEVKAYYVYGWMPQKLPTHVLDSGAPLEWRTWEEALDSPLGTDHLIVKTAKIHHDALEYARNNPRPSLRIRQRPNPEYGTSLTLQEYLDIVSIPTQPPYPTFSNDISIPPVARMSGVWPDIPEERANSESDQGRV